MRLRLINTNRKENLGNAAGIHPGLELNLGDERSKIDGIVLENMRIMIARILKKGKFPKRLSIFSSLSGEGVTSICLGLGATLANDYGFKVCIVDLNWYSPSTLFPSDSDCLGIADVIEGRAMLEDVLKTAGESSLFVLPAGRLEDYKRPVLARNKKLSELFDTLDRHFDHLILDVPAILSTSDAVHLATLGQECCLVIRQGITPIHDIKLALDETNHLLILGVVINQAILHTPNNLVKFLIE